MVNEKPLLEEPYLPPAAAAAARRSAAAAATAAAAAATAAAAGPAAAAAATAESPAAILVLPRRRAVRGGFGFGVGVGVGFGFGGEWYLAYLFLVLSESSPVGPPAIYLFVYPFANVPLVFFGHYNKFAISTVIMALALVVLIGYTCDISIDKDSMVPFGKLVNHSYALPIKVANNFAFIEIISPAQSAFVPGRLITDNVLLAFETNHFLNTHSRGRKHFMNLKLDFSKAYDRVEWSFLKRVLGKLGFPSAFIDLIMLCISSVSYSFVLSGSQFGSISPQRGLGQGDPLSPYLFLLCTESLRALFREAANRGSVPGVAVCSRAPRISHLLFADDTMVFTPADVPTMHAICQILNVYKLASGQEINLHKSSAVFSRNTPLDIQRDLAEALGLRLENKHELYLGLPAVVFRSKRALFAALKVSGTDSRA
ncbi:putative mitochondrial protein [Sesamum angolense]|uniref:Mitochondrial protein n=1 Tax=Sesamum angolense TaxID=2727404 RepID=A0AAE1W066_9LAMI|nr:putative mitochondrial protein [Sesamum angolense]